jgi:hypothetical protein
MIVGGSLASNTTQTTHDLSVSWKSCRRRRRPDTGISGQKGSIRTAYPSPGTRDEGKQVPKPRNISWLGSLFICDEAL